VPPAQRRAVVADRLKTLSPTWAGTHLGQAVLDAVSLVTESHDRTEEAGRAARRVVLVSDMQAGGRVSVLGDVAWPEGVQLELKRVKAKAPTNAGLWRLADDAKGDEPRSAAGKRELRIRVANAADSQAEQFKLAWVESAVAETGSSVDAYVPAGESRVIRVERPAASVRHPRLMLHGDGHRFDNTLYFIPSARTEFVVGYLGDDAANDPQRLRYYLDRAVTSDPVRDVRVEDFMKLADDAAAKDEPPPLVVATRTPAADELDRLRKYVGGGGTLLYVVADAQAGEGLGPVLGVDELPVEEAVVDGYTMFGEVNFGHALFAAMAGPRFNDFTRIRFWQYRKIDLAVVETEDVDVLARFENGDPAILEKRVGDGRIVALAAGWQPEDGQLARSWKFLLMMSALVDEGGTNRDFRTDYFVNERVPLPDHGVLGDAPKVSLPDGREAPLPADAEVFAEATQPGVYTLSGTKGSIRFVVNIDPTESDTAPLEAETFEQLGCRLAGRAESKLDAEHLQQLRDVELESRQRIWQWLVAATLGVLVVETLLAGRLSRSAEPQLAAA
jgi:hypothetical protein